jgi:hypothetical protein
VAAVFGYDASVEEVEEQEAAAEEAGGAAAAAGGQQRRRGLAVRLTDVTTPAGRIRRTASARQAVGGELLAGPLPCALPLGAIGGLLGQGRVWGGVG